MNKKQLVVGSTVVLVLAGGLVGHDANAAKKKQVLAVGSTALKPLA